LDISILKFIPAGNVAKLSRLIYNLHKREEGYCV